MNKFVALLAIVLARTCDSVFCQTGYSRGSRCQNCAEGFIARSPPAAFAGAKYCIPRDDDTAYQGTHCIAPYVLTFGQTCTICPEDRTETAWKLTGQTAAAVLFYAVYYRIIRRYPDKLKSWVSAFSLVMGHLQLLTIIFGLNLPWPSGFRFVKDAASVGWIGFSSIGVRPECIVVHDPIQDPVVIPGILSSNAGIFDSGDTVFDSGDTRPYLLIMLGLPLISLQFLQTSVAHLLCTSKARRNKLADRVELMNTLVFSFQLPKAIFGTWLILINPRNIGFGGKTLNTYVLALALLLFEVYWLFRYYRSIRFLVRELNVRPAPPTQDETDTPGDTAVQAFVLDDTFQSHNVSDDGGTIFRLALAQVYSSAIYKPNMQVPSKTQILKALKRHGNVRNMLKSATVMQPSAVRNVLLDVQKPLQEAFLALRTHASNQVTREEFVDFFASFAESLCATQHSPKEKRGLTRKLLVAFYEEHDEQKLDLVDSILDHPDLSVEIIHQTCMRKYGASPLPLVCSDEEVASSTAGDILAQNTNTIVGQQAVIQQRKPDVAKGRDSDGQQVLDRFFRAVFPQGHTKGYFMFAPGEGSGPSWSCDDIVCVLTPQDFPPGAQATFSCTIRIQRRIFCSWYSSYFRFPRERMQRRLEYLTKRFSARTPYWQFMKWAVQFAFLLLRFIPDATTTAGVAAAFTVVALVAHWRMQPYELRVLNRLQTVLYICITTMILLIIPYSVTIEGYRTANPNGTQGANVTQELTGSEACGEIQDAGLCAFGWIVCSAVLLSLVAIIATAVRTWVIPWVRLRLKQSKQTRATKSERHVPQLAGGARRGTQQFGTADRQGEIEMGVKGDAGPVCDGKEGYTSWSGGVGGGSGQAPSLARSWESSSRREEEGCGDEETKRATKSKWKKNTRKGSRANSNAQT